MSIHSPLVQVGDGCAHSASDVGRRCGLQSVASRITSPPVAETTNGWSCEVPGSPSGTGYATVAGGPGPSSKVRSAGTVAKTYCWTEESEVQLGLVPLGGGHALSSPERVMCSISTSPVPIWAVV